MINWTPLGTHPEVEKPKIPEALQLTKIGILLINVGLITGQFLTIGKVSYFTYGLTAIGTSIVTLVDFKYNYRSSGYFGRSVDFSIPLVFATIGVYLLLKP